MSPALLFPLLMAAAPPQESPAPEPACAATRPVLPVGFEGWSVRTPTDAGAGTRSAPVMVLGRATDLRLVPFDRLIPATPPVRIPEAGSVAGMALFQVARAGTYRFALGGPAWIEIVRGGHVVPAVAHGHGPACTGIRKMIDFRLAPGRYIMQLTGASAATLPVMIAPAQRVAA